MTPSMFFFIFFLQLVVLTGFLNEACGAETVNAPTPSQSEIGQDVFRRQELPLNERLVFWHQQRLDRFKKIKRRIEIDSEADILWTDNMDQEHEDGKHDWRLRHKTEVNLYAILARRKGILGGMNAGLRGYEYTRFSHRSDPQTRNNFYFFPFVQWIGGFQKNRLRLLFTEHLDPSLPSGPDDDNEDASYRINNIAKAQALYALNRDISLGLGYSNSLVYYTKKSEREEGNSISNTLSPMIQYEHRTNRMRFFMKPDLSMQTYKDKQNNASTLTLRGGVGRDLGGKSHFYFDFGPTWKHFSKRHATQSDLGGRIGYDQQISTRTRFGLVADRTVTDSLTTTPGIIPVQTEKEALRDDNPTITRTGFTGIFQHQLWRHLMFYFTGTYTIEKEKTEDSTSRIRGSTSLEYSFTPKLRLRFNYVLKKKLGSSEDRYLENVFYMSLHYTWGGDDEGAGFPR